MLEIMDDVSISARLTTTTTKVGWWSVGYHARCIHLSTVNYNYDEGDMMVCWRSCMMYMERSLGGYEFGLEIESVLEKFEKTIYNDI